MSQQEQKPQFILTQFTEKTDRNGKQYFYGQLGMLNISMFQSKNNPQKWNIFVTQKEKKEDQGFNNTPQSNDDDGFGSF